MHSILRWIDNPSCWPAILLPPLLYFPKAQEGKSVMDTRAIVDSGTYRIVRHPQVLGCMLLICGSIFISPHWLSAIVARSNIRIVLSICPKGGKTTSRGVWQ